MNKVLKIATKLLLGAVLLTSSTQALADKLDLSKGTMSLGGKGSFHHELANVSDWSNGKWSHGGEVHFGYFVIDRLAIMAHVEGEGGFSGNFLNRLGLGLGVGYFFNTNTIASPYLAVAVTGDVMPNWAMGVRPMAGVLIALNQHVAVDLGLAIAVKQNTAADPVTTGFNGKADLGFIGVRGFF